MTMVVGGTLGVTFPDSTTLAASAVTGALGPALTDTANVMTINPVVIVDGTNGLYANGTVYATVPPITISYLIVAGGGSGSVSGANTNVSGGGGGAERPQVLHLLHPAAAADRLQPCRRPHRADGEGGAGGPRQPCGQARHPGRAPAAGVTSAAAPLN